MDKYVYLFGGQDPESGLCYNDVQRFDPAKGSWEKVQPSSGKPAPRHAYCAGLVGSHSFAVFGGANQSNECANTLRAVEQFAQAYLVYFDAFGALQSAQ